MYVHPVSHRATAVSPWQESMFYWWTLRCAVASVMFNQCSISLCTENQVQTYGLQRKKVTKIRYDLIRYDMHNAMQISNGVLLKAVHWKDAKRPSGLDSGVVNVTTWVQPPALPMCCLSKFLAYERTSHITHHHHHADIYNAPITTKQEHRCSTKIQIMVDW